MRRGWWWMARWLALVAVTTAVLLVGLACLLGAVFLAVRLLGQ